jgi:hypothetical protein
VGVYSKVVLAAVAVVAVVFVVARVRRNRRERALATGRAIGRARAYDPR